MTKTRLMCTSMAGLLALSLATAAQAGLAITVLPTGSTTLAGNTSVTVEIFLMSDVNQLFKGSQVDMPCTITNSFGSLTTLGISINPSGGAGGTIPKLCPGGLAPTNQSLCFAAQTPAPGAMPCSVAAGVSRYMATMVYDVGDCAGGAYLANVESFTNPPTVTNGTRFRDEVGASGNLILVTGATGVNLTVPVGQCCSGQTCLGDRSQYCCQTVNSGTWYPLDSCDTDPCPCFGNADCNDGLFCTGTELCIANVCQPGTDPCTTPARPNCDEPNDQCVFCFTSAECDDGIFCNGVEQCVDGLCTSSPNLSLGTPCGDPADTDCTDPDTCNGFGSCRANNTPSGTLCEDGLFCTEGSTCFGGSCLGGTPRNCSDGLNCTTDACDELADACTNTLGANSCLIAGACYAEGDDNPANDCEECVTLLTSTNWSDKADKTPCTDDGNDCTNDECTAGVCTHPNLAAGFLCDDGDPCTGTGDPGVGVDECDGAGDCVGLADPDCNDDCATAVVALEGATPGDLTNAGADDAEASCQPDSNRDIWYKYTATCSGLVLINTHGSNLTPSNDTVLSVYDSCGGVEIACDDDGGLGLLSALSFNAIEGTMYFIRVAAFAENSGLITLNIRTVNDCVIDGLCYAEDEINPSNLCEACRPDLSSSSWSPRLKGSSCGNPADSDCNSPDACDGAGNCESNFKPDGSSCTSDLNDCTVDICNSGVCVHNNLAFGTACGSPDDTGCDNPDTCDGAGTCLSNFEPSGFDCGDPTDTDCDNPDSCSGAGVCNDNLEVNGTVCTDDGNECKSDVCDAGVCTHPNRPSGFACGSPVNTQCDNPDTCNGFGFCIENLEPDGLPCGDGDTCTSGDSCQGGLCVGSPVPQQPVVVSIGSRRLQVTPQPPGSVIPVALRVTSPDYPCLLVWIDASGGISNVPIFQTPDFWGVLVVSGFEIQHSTTYHVQAECGTFLSTPGIADTWLFGDLNNDMMVDVDDLIILLDAYTGVFIFGTLEATDIANCELDGVVDVDDLIFFLDAFAGRPKLCPPPC